MVSVRWLLPISMLFFAAAGARADVIFGVDAAVPILDSKNIDDVPTSSEVSYDGYMMVQLRKDSSTYVTLGYRLMTSTAPISATSSSTLQTNAPYGGFDWSWNTGFYNFGVYWSPYIQGDYSRNGGDSEVWIGSAVYTKFAVHPKISGTFQLDLAMSYFSANYSSKTSANSVSSVDSFSQGVFSPMIGFRYGF